MGYCYFQGSVVKESEVSFPIHNLGITRGFGVFDFFRMRKGNYCFLQDHLDRFERSQKFMQLSAIISQDEIRGAIDALSERNKYKDAGFKLFLFGDGKETDEKLSPLFYITHTNLNNHTSETYARVILHEYTREYAEIKSVNYFTSNILHYKRVKAGAIDIIYHKDNQISEASRSNVFIVKDGILSTPKDHILEGITRKSVLQFAPQVIETRIGPISIQDFRHADEVFICSTLKEICPIVEVDGALIGKGKVGPITRKINQLFQEKIKGEFIPITG
ncbi:MAG: aminotransferase class IV [Bacteroidota bacterium]